MRLQYTYEESDCYEYDPEPTYIGGAPPTRTEGIPVGWKKGSFAEQDGLDLATPISAISTTGTAAIGRRSS